MNDPEAVKADHEQSYFSTYLHNYLVNNGFQITPALLALIDVNSENAAENYSEQISFGNTQQGAMEIAMLSLFANVGESELSIISDVLEENFKNIHPLETSADIEMAARNYMQSIPDLFKYIPRMEVGISTDELDKIKTIITGRIAQYIEDNGI